MRQTQLIRRLAEIDAGKLWELRLEALKTEPDAFVESVNEHLRTSIDSFAGKLRNSSPDNFVLGAFAEARLVGMVGFYRDTREKRSHRGRIWGMFVSSSHRRKGIGRALLNAVLEDACALPGIDNVDLSVTTSQAAARQLYLSVGFRSFGIEPEALITDHGHIDEEHFLYRCPLRSGK